HTPTENIRKTTQKPRTIPKKIVPGQTTFDNITLDDGKTDTEGKGGTADNSLEEDARQLSGAQLAAAPDVKTTPASSTGGIQKYRQRRKARSKFNRIASEKSAEKSDSEVSATVTTPKTPAVVTAITNSFGGATSPTTGGSNKVKVTVTSGEPLPGLDHS
ncbi:MAG: hypothetical protein ACT4OY_08960, partial [Alphaproteobacteria bacterium]